MKILLLFDDDLKSAKSAPVMMRQLCMAYKALGHEPVLMVPDCEQKDVCCETVVDGGFKIIKFRSGRLKNIGFIKRAVNESLLSYNVLRAWKHFRKEQKFDMIAAYSPTIFWGIAVRRMKRYWKCPAYLILRDLFPQWTLDSGLLHRYSPAYWYFKFFESLNYSAYERIGVQTEGNLKYFERRRERGKVEVLNNWFIAPPAATLVSYKEKYGLKGKIVFFYGGNIGFAQDMMNIVRLAENMLPYSQAHFLLVGKGDEWNLVEEERKRRKLTNLTLLPACSQDEYWSILNEMDIGIFTLNSQHTTQNVPGKLLGYMAFNKPIVGSINSGNDLLELWERNRAGLLSVNPDDQEFLKNAVSLLQSESLCKELGENAGKLLQEQFSPEAIARQIITILGADID
ncbi:MAG: glycosyltransferase family 4 protein [Lentisphaeria bacterium]|nr:glycosyltransferase family 4 protein [Lentisphaeria bacterium]